MKKLPDYRIAAMNKVTDLKGRVGAAWKNNDGSISLVLDAFITLTSSKDLVITMFPDNKPKNNPSRPEQDIPF